MIFKPVGFIHEGGEIVNLLNKKKSDMSGDRKQQKNPADAAQKTAWKPQEISLELIDSRNREWSRCGISRKIKEVIQY